MKLMVSVLVSVSCVVFFPLPSSARDMELDYSTYLGGILADRLSDIAVDASGACYATGYTQSSNFPTVNPYQPQIAHDFDGFVSKLSADGSVLIYSTYLGGYGENCPQGIALNNSGVVYLTGYTNSREFPTFNPYQASFSSASGTNAFVTQLSSTGSALISSTYLGGEVSEEGAGIAVGSDGKIYITGYTRSENFPTVDPYQPSFAGGWSDIFVSTFSSSGSSLIYSTYYGGSMYDVGNSLVLDSSDVPYVVGCTESPDFPTSKAYQASLAGGYDVCLFRLGPIPASTYLGGSSYETGEGIALNPSAGVYVTGNTLSPDFPTRNAYQSSLASSFLSDAFLCSIPLGSQILNFSTYLGGENSDYVYDIAVDSEYNPYLIGGTGSADFPTRNPYQPSINVDWEAFQEDAFLSVFSADDGALTHSTYLGGVAPDTGYAIAAGVDGRMYVGGITGSDDFPTLNPYQANRASETVGPPIWGIDAFLALFSFPPPASKFHTDFNGDGRSDIAVFRDWSAFWAIRGITRKYFGKPGDSPVPGDYDGDGTTELAIFRADRGLWASSGGIRLYFGSTADIPISGDYNGDGTWEPAIFRGSTGLWAVLGVTRTYFGQTGDTPMPGYYAGEDGDNMIGVFREKNGLWRVKDWNPVYFGSSGDTPAPGDYNGNGYWSFAIYRPGTGLWAQAGGNRTYYGQSADQAVPGDYDGNGTDGIGIFRENSGLWAIRGFTRVYYGMNGDTTITR